jgi:hypothetical protein
LPENAKPRDVKSRFFSDSEVWDASIAPLSSDLAGATEALDNREMEVVDALMAVLTVPVVAELLSVNRP